MGLFFFQGTGIRIGFETLLAHPYHITPKLPPTIPEPATIDANPAFRFFFLSFCTCIICVILFWYMRHVFCVDQCLRLHSLLFYVVSGTSCVSCASDNLKATCIYNCQLYFLLLSIWCNPVLVSEAALIATLFNFTSCVSCDLMATCYNGCQHC